jgi:hypothetical protein
MMMMGHDGGDVCGMGRWDGVGDQDRYMNTYNEVEETWKGMRTGTGMEMGRRVGLGIEVEMVTVIGTKMGVRMGTETRIKRGMKIEMRKERKTKKGTPNVSVCRSSLTRLLRKVVSGSLRVWGEKEKKKKNE